MSAPAQDRKFQLWAGGGLNHHFVYGSNQDYVLGRNDFPVTPAHNPLVFGLGYAVLFGRFGIEAEGRATLSSKVLLTDPSDGDTVEISTHSHLSWTASVFYQFFSRAIRPYLLAGAGLDIVLAKDAHYTSRNGYPIDIPAPAGDDRLDMEVHAGAGVFIWLGSALGLRLDGRSVWIFDKPHTVTSLQASSGFVFRF